MATRIEQLRRLAAEYWQPMIGAVAAVYGVLAALALRWTSVPLSPQSTEGKLIGIAAALAVVIVIRRPAVAYRVVQLLVPADPVPENRRGFRGLLPYTRGEEVPGRAHDIEQCRVRLQRGRFVVLDGETGCGKTSIVSAALLPLMEQSQRVVELRLGGDPLRALYRALAPGADVPRQVGREQILSLLRPSAEGAPFAPPLVVIDQFEELFALSPEKVRRRLATVLRELVESGARVMVVIRSDFLDLFIPLCAEADPDGRALDLSAWHTLKAFREGAASEVVEEILREVSKDDALREQDVRSLAGILARELLRPPRDTRLSREDAWTVLPVELQSVGLTLQLTGARNLSAEGYRRAGGRPGLMRAFIEDTKRFVYISSGVDGETTLLVLRELTSSVGTRQPRTFAELQAADTLSALSQRQLRAVLQALEQRFLIQKAVAPTTAAGPEEVRYELVHEYLAHILSEVPDPTIRKIRDAEERLQFWLARTQGVDQTQGRLGRWFSQPIPLLESLRLRRFPRSEEARRMLRANIRGFKTRMTAILLPCVLAGLGGWVWWSSDQHQVDLTAEAGTTVAMQLSGEDATAVRMQWMIALGEVGRTEDAIRVSRSIPDLDWRSTTLFAVADALNGRGHVDAGAAILRAALAIGYGLEGDSTTLSRIATSLIRLGNLDETLTLPVSAERSSPRARAYADVAIVLAKAGFDSLAAETLRQARNASAQVEDTTVRVSVLARIVRAGVESQRRSELSTAAEELWTTLSVLPGDSFSVVIPTAAAALARAGETERSRKAMQRALSLDSARTVVYYSDEIVSAFQVAFADLARVGETPWVLRTLRSRQLNVAVLYLAARGLAEAGQIDSALAVADMIDDPLQHRGILAEIGKLVLEDLTRLRLRPTRHVIFGPT
jgi:DNA-binding HxlR family transcriptional regulator